MKRVWLVPVLLVVAVLGTVAVQRPPALRSAVSIATTTVRSDKHHLPLLKCGRLALRATHNHAVIARAATYAGACGSNTGLYTRIAQAAADLDVACPELERVLDLAIMSESNGGAILALARSACRARTPEEAQRWEQVLDALRAGATYEDVETALAERCLTP